MSWIVEIPLIVTIALSGYLTVFAWRRRPVLGAEIFSILMASVTIWVFSAAISVYSATIEPALFWQKVAYIGIVVVPPAAFILSAQFTQHRKVFSRRFVTLLCIEPILVTLLIWSNDSHRLFWESARLVEGSYFNIIQFQYGSAFWVHVIYTYMLLLASAYLLVRSILTSHGIYRRQAFMLLFSAILPFIGRIVYLLYLNSFPFIDPTPYLFTIASPILAWGLFNLRLLNVVPVAYDTIVENMSDGLIVLDAENRLMEMNPAAEEVFDFQARDSVGQPVSKLLAEWDSLAEKLTSVTKSRVEVTILLKDKPRWFDLLITPIFNKAGKLSGRMIVIRDITFRKRREDSEKRKAQELLVLNAMLLDITASRDLDNLLQVIIERAINLLRGQGGCLYLTEPQRREVRCAASDNLPGEAVGNVNKYGTGIAGTVAQTGVAQIFTGQLPDATVDEEGADPKVILAAPLTWQGKVTGVICIRGNDSAPDPQSDLNLLTMLARQASIVVENARLLQAEREQREQAEILREISSVINSSLDLKKVLEMILEQLSRVVSYDSTSLMLIKENVLEIVAQQGFRNVDGYTYPFEIDELKHAKEVIEERLPIIISDTKEDSRWLPVADGEFIRCWMGVPLVYQGKAIGLLNLDKEQPNYYTSHDAELAAAFANQVVIAVENAQLFEAAGQRAQEAETLREATSVVAATLRKEEAIERILEQLARVIDYDSASVQLLEDGELAIVGGRGWPTGRSIVGMRFPVPGDNPNTIVIQRCEPYILNDAPERYPTFKTGLHQHIRSWLGVPLIVHDRVIGMFAVDSCKDNFFTEHHSQLVSAFADQVAIAIENARLFAEAEHRANELSQLYTAAQDLAETLNPGIILDKLAKHLVEALNATSGCILEVNFSEDRLKIVAEYFAEEACDAENVTDLNQTYQLSHYPVLFEAYRSGEPLNYHADSPAISQPERDELIRYGIKSALLVPIILRGHLVGEVEIWESRRRRIFSDSEKRLAIALSQHAAAVLENAQLFAQERARVQELDALRATMSDISSELELPKLLEAILKRSVDFLHASGGELGLLENEKCQLEVVACYNMGRDYSGTILEPGEGVMGRVVQTNTPLMIPDYPNWEGRSDQYKEDKVNTVVAVPLMIRGRLLGVIGVIDTNPNRQFNETEQNLLYMFAQQAAIAVENARLFQEALRAAERRAILHDVSQEVVTASLDPEGIYTALHRASSKLMPTEAFAITLVDETRDMIDAVYIYDHKGRAKPISVPKGRGISGHVIKSGEPLYIEDMLEKLNSIDSIRVGDKEEVRSIIAVPMHLGEKITGTLSAQSYNPRAYTTEDVRLLEMLASYAAIALDNSRLFLEVQKLAITDAVTGIFNRRQLFELGQREFSRSLRFGRPLTAIFFDIDYFKRVNDTYGHPIGDVVLRLLSQRVQEMVREIDILGRYGGEEFVIILPETSIAAAEWVAERIRKKIAETPFSTEKGPVDITISLGVCEMSPDIADFAALVSKADTAMYDAKQAGRNHVAIR